MNLSNIGEKIKNVALVFLALGALASLSSAGVMVVIGFLSIRDLWWLLPLAPICAMIGCVVTWVAFLPIYGYGQMLEDVHEIRKAATTQKEEDPITQEKNSAETTTKQEKKNKEKHEAKMRAYLNDQEEAAERAKRQEEEKLKRIAEYTANQTPASSNICQCGTRFYGDTCPSCGRTLEQKDHELKAEKAAEKKANFAEQRENAKMQKRIDKYTSKHTIKNLQSQQESVSKICECGERFYGKTCPVCGRTFKNK